MHSRVQFLPSAEASLGHPSAHPAAAGRIGPVYFISVIINIISKAALIFDF